MSNQFPGGYNSPLSGHRGNFGNQMVNMNMVQNQMGMMGYNQGGMMNHPQQSQMQNNAMGMNTQGLNHGTGDLQNSPHPQQQPNQQTLQQQQIQQQLQQQQQQMQQQQQQAPQLTLQSASTPTPTTTMMSQQNMQQQQPQTGMLTTNAPQLPQKEINTVSLTKLGQETVQDITSRFQEIFSALKTIQPAGNRENTTEKKVQEYFRTIRLLFKRLRIIYEKSNDGCSQGNLLNNLILSKSRN